MKAIIRNNNIPYQFLYILKRRLPVLKITGRQFSTDYKTSNENSFPLCKGRMRGWITNSYGDLETNLKLSEDINIPKIKGLRDVLVQVESSGVNPIDVAMINGYGSKLISFLRNYSNEFPLTVGREFSGTLIQKGFRCDTDIKIGDQVWGVIPVQNTGSHAEYVLTNESHITKKPENLSTLEAGSTLYAALTAWSGIFIAGNFGGISNLSPYSKLDCGRGKRVLVIGASGGLGSSAVQILKTEQATVIASCSTDAIPTVQSLGPDEIIDYTNQEDTSKFSSCGPYDLIIDCAGQGSEYAKKFSWNYKSFITFTTPLLKNVDEHGYAVGMFHNLTDIVERNVHSLSAQNGLIKWAYFVPCKQGILYLKSLADEGKFKPIIDSTFDFDNSLEAYKKVQNGHLRGKVVINFKK